MKPNINTKKETPLYFTRWADFLFALVLTPFFFFLRNYNLTAAIITEMTAIGPKTAPTMLPIVLPNNKWDHM